MSNEPRTLHASSDDDAKTSQLLPGQFEALFDEPGVQMTPQQARRQLAQHHGLAIMDHEIDHLVRVADRTRIGFESILVKVKELIEAADRPTAEALASLLAPLPDTEHKGQDRLRAIRVELNPQTELERLIRLDLTVAHVRARCWELTKPGPLGRFHVWGRR